MLQKELEQMPSLACGCDPYKYGDIWCVDV
jgi:hypothetical protein